MWQILLVPVKGFVTCTLPSSSVMLACRGLLAKERDDVIKSKRSSAQTAQKVKCCRLPVGTLHVVACCSITVAAAPPTRAPSMWLNIGVAVVLLATWDPSLALPPTAWCTSALPCTIPKQSCSSQACVTMVTVVATVECDDAINRLECTSASKAGSVSALPARGAEDCVGPSQRC